MDNQETIRTFKLNDNDQPLSDVLDVDGFALTFGVELEFMIAGLQEDSKDPHPKDPRPVDDRFSWLHAGLRADEDILDHIGRTLFENGVRSEECPDTKRNNFIVDYPESWVVTSDPSIQPPPLPEHHRHYGVFKYHKVELNSPALYFNENSLAAVAQVCGIMTSSYRVHTNWSCALHVHVGESRRGFSLRTQQNLMATLLTFEPQFQKIHPSAFRGAPDNLYPYAPDLRNWSSLRDLPGLHVPTRQSSAREKADIEREFLTRALDEIFEAELGDLQRLASFKGPRREGTDGRMAYNIKNLYDAPAGTLGEPKSKRTVEFRQHEGTMDPERVVNWIRFCAGLLEFADTVKQETLRPFLERHLELPDATGPAVLNMGQILTALGMYDIAGYYHNLVGVESTAVTGDAADALADAMADAML